MTTPIKLMLVLACVLAVESSARAQCAPPELYVDCGDGSCCQRSTPVCCRYVCCSSNGRCSADGTSCVPIDSEEEEPDVPTLPTCPEGSSVVLNACGTTDDACGCTHSCTTSAECATGCCFQGRCALACVCAGPATVNLSPTPEQCQQAGATEVEPMNAPPIGGFGGPGCSTGGGAGAALAWVGAALLLVRRRKRTSA